MTYAILLLMLGMSPGAASALTLAAADWPLPRHAETLVAHKPLGDFLLNFDQHNDGMLLVRHAGGESGSRFARQFRDALVAFGLPSERIRLVPAAADSDQLILEYSVMGDITP